MPILINKETNERVNKLNRFNYQPNRIDITKHYNGITIHNFNDSNIGIDDNVFDDVYYIEEEVNDPRDKHLFTKLARVKKEELYDQVEM